MRVRSKSLGLKTSYCNCKVDLILLLAIFIVFDIDFVQADKLLSG